MTRTILRRKKSSKVKKKRIRFLPFFFVILLLAVSVYILSTLWRIVPSFLGSGDDSKPIRVEVLNGCGIPKLARGVSWELRRLGLDVVSVGDARQQDFDQTVIVERRSEKLRNARKLAVAIGCKRILKDIDSTLYLEATLILGSDYQKFFPHLKLESE
jgi:hypothetical protein